jgi:UDP-glucose 4-epimerase
MSPDPLSPYALQKWVGERYCKLYSALYELETVSLRYFNVFGPDQDPDSEYSAVIPRFIRALLDDEPITVYGDGEQSRDFTYVENVIAANMLATQASNAPGKVFNIGCGKRISLNQLVSVLGEIVGRKPIVRYTDPRPGDVRHSLADINSAWKNLGYSPSIMVEEGLKKTVQWMQKKGLRS